MRISLLIAVLGAGLAGCGGAPDIERPELIPTAGVVKQGEAPLADAEVRLIPIEKTPGQGATGRTDAEGKFQLVAWTGEAGAPAGKYRITVSRRLMPDGTPVPANDPTPPIESPAVESLPPKYSSPEASELTATIIPDGPPIEILLQP